MKGNPQLNVYVKEFPAPQYMMMNTKVKPLDDVRVRRAIQHLWNRAAWKASLGGVVGEQLAPAPLELPRRAPEGVVRHLQRHDPPEPGVPGPPDSAEPARPDLLQEFEPVERPW